MSDKITSQNQSGGVTAHAVSVTGGTHIDHAPKESRRIPWKKWGSIAGIIGAIVALLTYLNFPPSVTQVPVAPNPVGGVTAHTVNVGHQPRVLTEHDKTQLLSIMPKKTKVKVTAALGDAESFRYAEQITNFLRSAGYNVDGVNQALGIPPITGQSIFAVSDGYHIRIGPSM